MDGFRIPISIELVDNTPKEGIDWIAWIPILVSIFSVILIFMQAQDTKENNENVLRQQKTNNEDILKQQKELGDAKIKADIVSKSRIEWNQKVREESANFISDCFKYLDYAITKGLSVRQLSPEELSKIQHNATKKVGAHGAVEVTTTEIPPTTKINGDDEIPKDREKIRNQIYKSGNLLILYFSPDESKKNINIVKKMNHILYVVSDDKVHEDLQKLVIEFRDEIRIYLKIEWMRAIGTIEDNEASECLEKFRILLNDEK